MSNVYRQARPSDEDAARKRNSLLGVLALGRGRRVSRQEKGKQRASVDLHDVQEHENDEHEQLRGAAARSAGLPSILPELGEGDGDSTVRRRPPALDLHDRQAARDEAAAKLCGLVPPSAPPLPPVPVFPCAQSALAAHTQLSGPLLKHHPPTALARLVGTKAWKPRHAVLCTYSLRSCTCARPHRSSGDSICDAPTRTLACLHIFATPTPDALELARLVVTEDSVVFVVEPTLSADDSRRGPRDVADRKWVIQVRGINGTPPPPIADRQPKRILSRRRESVGVATASLRSGISGRPRTVASLGIAPNSNSAPGLGSTLNLTLDDDAQVHAVWFLQCPDVDARQRWTSCIKRAVLLQRAERAGFGGTVHFTSARSVTDPLPSGDLDVVLALRAHAQSAHIAQLRASTSSPHPALPILSQPATPVTATFGPGLTSSFVPVFSPTATTFSPTSVGLPAASDHSHTDALSLAFTRSQTPTYAPSVHTTHTTQTQPLPDRSRSRSNTVTNSAPVQALRGFFSLGSGGSRPPSRSASVTAGVTNGNIGGGKKSRARAASSSAAAAGGLQQSHPYAVPVPPFGHVEGQSPAPTSISFASAFDQGDTYPYSQPQPHPYPYGPVMLGTPISAGLGSMDLGDRDRERERERDELGNGVLGLNFGYGNAGLPGLGVNGLPGLGPNGISSLPGLSGKSPVGSSGGKGMVTSLPPPPRARRAGSVSHVLPGRAQEDGPGTGAAMGRVQEESSVRGGRPHTTEGALRREDSEGGSRRPSLVPMMSLSFGQVGGLTESPSGGEDTDGEYGEQGVACHREPRVLPPQLAPPSAPLPLPPGSWPIASDSSQASMYSVQTTSTGTGARVSDVRGSLGARGSVDGRGGASSSNGLDRSRLSLGDGPRPNTDASWSRSRVSLGDVPRESPGASRAHSRVSLALVRGTLAEHPEGDGWDDGEGAGTTGSYRESPTWTSVRESPTRTRESPTRPSGRGTSPIAFTRRSTTDSAPSSPSSHADGPAREGSSLFSRESFGSAFISREFEGDQISHPFASQGQGRRAHRRTGSYGGPTLFTIADLPVGRSRSQRGKSEMLPPAAPPPSVPLPPVPPPTGPLPPLPVSSRPVTPVSRPRTPSRLGIASSQTPGSSAIQLAIPVAAPQPRHTSLRTRLRMLSAPSPAPQSALPEPPRDLSSLAEDELAQPISKVPISLLVRDDSSARRATNEPGARRELEREGAPSLPPPPRIRIVRQHSHSASSDREGTSEGRRSDESGMGGKVVTGLRDSAVHLENRSRGIGQPLSLLLKQDKHVSSLSLYDIRGAPGVAADVSHVDTPSTVKGYPQAKLAEALNGVKVVVIPAGVPRKPGMTRDDLFNTNAGIVRDLAQAIADNAPDAYVLIISNPVNSTVPIAAEVLKKANKFDPKRLFGVTTLDVVRAARFLSEVDGVATPDQCPVTVVGGHSGVTIVPLLSQAEVGKSLSPETDKWKALVNRIQFGGDEVVKAKDGAGSATLSMAYAAAKFTNQLLRALGGEKGIVAPTFVRSHLYENDGVDYFSSAVELSTSGVGKIYPVGNVSPAEQQLIDACLPELKKNILKGAKFVTGA
ncbi:Malate dehydrogenase, cytoplasmic [Ceratobasidium sp. 414]|nr:Malate dehydrogenase, cytoplasmic [Ceratobasidium sp. 414]